MMQLGLLMDHRLTRQSSPPVASSRPEALPSTSEDTLLAWATISSIQGRTGGEGSQRASLGHREEGRACPARPLGLAPEAQVEGSTRFGSPLGPDTPARPRSLAARAGLAPEAGMTISQLRVFLSHPQAARFALFSAHQLVKLPCFLCSI